MRSDRSSSAGSWMLLASVLLTGASLAQEPPQPDEIYRAEEQVTTLDLLVGLDKEAEHVRPGELEVLWDGEPRPVITIQGGPGPGDWDIVIVVDHELAGDATRHQATALLARHAEDLTEMGPVEVLEWTTSLRRVLAPTTDPELLDQTLSGSSLTGEDEDGILGLRRELLGDTADLEGSERAALVSAAAGLEAARHQRRFDELLLRLQARQPAAAHPLLLLVTDGWDLDPEATYGSPGDSRMRAPSEDLAQNLAALGWTVASLAGSERREPRAGFRIGKFFFYGLPPAIEENLGRGGKPTSHPLARLALLGFKYEENRDPDLAAAHAELARALHGQGKLDDARDSFGKAIYHYGEDPETFPEKARATLGLAEVLAEQDDIEGARTATAEALWLDPTLAEQVTVEAFTAPEEPLELLAEASAGFVVHEERDLLEAYDQLTSRSVVVFQVGGEPDGELHRVEALRNSSAKTLPAPRWARFGVAPGISAARARRALEGVEEANELRALLDGTESVVFEWTAENPDEPTRLRAWVACASSDSLPTTHGPWPVSIENGTGRLALPCLAEAEGDSETLAGVLIEDLVTGQWRHALVEP